MRVIDAKRAHLERPDGMLVRMCAEDVAVYPLAELLPHLVLVVEGGVQDAGRLALPEGLYIPLRSSSNLGSVCYNTCH